MGFIPHLAKYRYIAMIKKCFGLSMVNFIYLDKLEPF